MRPTFCNFNSPKQRTGEYLYPQIDVFGKTMNYEKQWPLTTNKRTHTMGLEKRFRKRILQEKKDSELPGPCTFETEHPHKTIEAAINSSHHIVKKISSIKFLFQSTIPLIGFPYPKDNTYSIFDGNCIIRDSTFASLSHRQNKNRLLQTSEVEL